MSKPLCAIFDIDGTLADISHRLHFVKGDKKDFDSFNDACHLDTPKKDIVMLAQMVRWSTNLVFVTGREDKHRFKTSAWIRKHLDISFPMIYMRKTGDCRPDEVIKEEFLADIRERCDISFVVDDRDKVVEMWRRNGLTCLQCQKGDY